MTMMAVKSSVDFGESSSATRHRYGRALVLHRRFDLVTLRKIIDQKCFKAPPSLRKVAA